MCATGGPGTLWVTRPYRYLCLTTLGLLYQLNASYVPTTEPVHATRAHCDAPLHATSWCATLHCGIHRTWAHCDAPLHATSWCATLHCGMQRIPLIDSVLLPKSQYTINAIPMTWGYYQAPSFIVHRLVHTNADRTCYTQRRPTSSEVFQSWLFNHRTRTTV